MPRNPAVGQRVQAEAGAAGAAAQRARRRQNVATFSMFSGLTSTDRFIQFDSIASRGGAQLQL